MSRFMDNDIDAGAPIGDPLANPEGASEPMAALEGVDGSSTRQSTLRSNLLLLLFVGGVAAGSMWLMRTWSENSGVALTDVKIEYTSPSDKNDGDTADLIELLSFGSGVQVPLDDVRSRPFSMPSKGVEDPVEDTRPAHDPNAAARRAAEMRRAAIQKAFDSLELNSVITGSIPIARVSGQPVRIGDKVGEFFSVREIRDRSVVLEADEEMYILALQ
ncbi:MAG: hypothetical protein ACF8GE_09130 [Phycisphaerales bacterium JB043]